MQAAIEVFLNGISGVFIGLAVLYATIKLIGFVVAPKPDKKKEE